jgi:hypothetical protein
MESNAKRPQTSPSASPVGSNRRHAYCPLCGQARQMLATDVRHTEDALCPGRCETAWHAVTALRLRESSSRRVASRRRTESETQQDHLPALSELLLQRWRSGDWKVTPESVLDQVAADAEKT